MGFFADNAPGKIATTDRPDLNVADQGWLPGERQEPTRYVPGMSPLDGSNAGPAPAGSSPDLTGSQTNQMHSAQEVAALWRELTGRDATPQESGQWGQGNIDDAYFARIRATIAATPEAVAYKQQQDGLPSQGTGPAAGSTPPASGDDWSSKDYSNVDNVKAYFKSRGVDVSDSSAQYWAQKYNSPEFNGDRQYFFQRLGQAEEFGGGGGGTGANYLSPWGGAYTPPTYTPPPDFQAPDPSKIFDDPSFKSRMTNGLNAMERSAAAKGTLLTGGTMADEQAFGQDMATQEYDKVYGRAVSEDQTKYGRSLDTYGIARDNTLAQYNDSKGTFYDNQDRPFNKLLQTSQLGLSGLNAQNSFNAQYIGQYSNGLYNGANGVNAGQTGAANATAAGNVGASNAYSQAYQNAFQNWAYLYAQQHPWTGGGQSPISFNQPNAGNS